MQELLQLQTQVAAEADQEMDLLQEMEEVEL